MKVYEGSLYLETKSSDAKEIINSNAFLWLFGLMLHLNMVTADAMKKP